MAGSVNPSARAALERYKLEASAELGINMKAGNKSSVSSKTGSAGSQMAKKIIIAHENGLQ